MGAVLSLTGPAGEQGQNIRKGIELAVSEAITQGKNIKLILEDDGTNPAKVVSGINKLIDHDNVQGIVGGVWDYLAASAYPVVESREVVFVTPTNPFEIIPPQFQHSKVISTVAPSLSTEREAMKRYLKRVYPKSVMVVYPELPFGKSKQEAFESVAHDLQIPVLSAYAFTEDENRGEAMKRASLKIAESHAEAALVITDYDGLTVLAKEFKKLSINTSILTSQHLDQAVMFSGQSELFENMFGLYPKIYDQDFSLRFEKKFHESPKVFSAHGYDAAKLILARDGEKFQGVTGMCQKGGIVGCIGDTVLYGLKDGKVQQVE